MEWAVQRDAATIGRNRPAHDDMPFVRTADGTRLYVKDWGRGPPVILLHSWPLNADCFDEVAYTLAGAGYRVIAYDRRGFGRSSQPWDGYDYDTLSDDLAAVIEALDLRGASLVGYSMGGGEIVRYLRRCRTSSIERIVFISSQIFGLRRSATNPAGIDPSQIELFKAAIQRDRARFFADLFLPDFYNADFLSSTVSQAVVHWSSDLAMQASVRALAETIDAWGLTDFAVDLERVSVPTLVIHGTADKMVPLGDIPISARVSIPDAKVIEYEGAPHGIVASHPDRLLSDLLAFLSG